MASCSRIKPSPNKICIADFKHKIIFQLRSIGGTNTPGASSSTNFANITTVFSMIKTGASNRFIDGVNASPAINTDFYTRFNSLINLDVQLWIEWENKKFKVINTENIDKRNKFFRFRAVEHGDENLNANLA